MTKLITITNITGTTSIINVAAITRVAYDGIDENEVNGVRTAKIVFNSGESMEVDFNWLNALMEAGYLTVGDPIGELREKNGINAL